MPMRLFATGNFLSSRTAAEAAIADGDERGRHCEIELIKPETNVTGIAIFCKETICATKEADSSRHFFNQISLTWPKQQDVDDSSITKYIIEGVQKSINNTDDVWVVGKLEMNPRQYSAKYAHIAVFHSFLATFADNGEIYEKYTAKSYFEDILSYMSSKTKKVDDSKSLRLPQHPKMLIMQALSCKGNTPGIIILSSTFIPESKLIFFACSLWR